MVPPLIVLSLVGSREERKRNEGGALVSFARLRCCGECRGGVFREQAGVPGVASEGLRSAKILALREAPQPRRNSGLPAHLLRRLVVCPVDPAVALVTECLSPEDLSPPIGSAGPRVSGHFGQLAGGGQIAGDAVRVLNHGE